MSKYYTMQEAAKALNLSPGRVRQMVLYAPNHPQYLESTVITTEFGDKRRVILEAALVGMINKRMSWWQKHQDAPDTD